MSSMVIWLLYIVIIGGDIFPAYRHFNVILLILSFITLIGSNDFLIRLKEHKKAGYLTLFLSIIFLLFYFKGQFNDVMLKGAKAEQWEWNGKEVALLLKNGFEKQKPLIATSAAGCIPFWSELPVIDTIGLNDYYIPRYNKRNPLEKRIAHGFGDGYYVLSRQPDIIIFCGPMGSMGPCFTSEVQMFDTMEFKENYMPVIFTVKNNDKKINSIIWINKNSPKIGLVKDDKQIIIPAYLLDNNNRNVVYLDREANIFKIKVSKETPAVFSGLELQKSRYLIKTEPEISGIVEIKDLISNDIKRGDMSFIFNSETSEYEIKIIPEEECKIVEVIIEKF